jgi:hypothetical protein
MPSSVMERNLSDDDSRLKIFASISEAIQEFMQGNSCGNQHKNLYFVAYSHYFLINSALQAGEFSKNLLTFPAGIPSKHL